MRFRTLQCVLLGMLLSVASRAIGGQQPEKPPHQDQKQSPSQGSHQDAGACDPFHAKQDVEIGTFYMHKGDLDAALDRFQDAIRLRPNFAKPRLLLAEVYEKKSDKAAAVKYYREYLQVLPG